MSKSKKKSWLDGLSTKPTQPERSKPAQLEFKDEVESQWVTLQNPLGAGDAGIAEPVYFRVSTDGKSFFMCDTFGESIGQVIQLQPGETARQVAARLKRREWTNANPTSDFWRPLTSKSYPRMVY